MPLFVCDTAGVQPSVPSELDAGCGAGALAEAMLERGASVTGLEISEGMAQLARERLGQRASVHVADLAQPLTMCADASLDLVVASLVLHYLERWEPTLGEFGRVLVPGGVTAMIAAFRSTGFVIDDLVEPMPVAECAERFPDQYISLTTAPRFLFVRLRKPR
jgi:ubiquinone/menaquinone biosynthesis C-methylase UbiE